MTVTTNSYLRNSGVIRCSTLTVNNGGTFKDMGVDAGADITVTTMSGRIENGLGPDRPSRPAHGPGQRLSFSTGGGGAKVSIQTLSGSVILVGR